MRLAIALVAGAVLAVGCTPKSGPCMSMGAGALVVGAKVVRLDVYGAGAHCAGDRLQTGAPTPTQSLAVSAGVPLKLDVPPGAHVLLLSAYADDAATQLLGTACEEVTLQKDKAACFNLTLQPLPDMAMAPPDLFMACSSSPDSCGAGQFCGPDGLCVAGCKDASDCAATPATALCNLAMHACVACLASSDCSPGERCSTSGNCVVGCDPNGGSTCQSGTSCCPAESLCIDTSTGDPANCGACGRACSSANTVGALRCGTSVCAPMCAAGFADCSTPAAPAPDDGCETNIHTNAHCGSCGGSCAPANATGSCASGTCTIASCNSGKADCDKNAGNGCECPAIADANGGCCVSGACETTHSDGFGHPFYDCEALGTHDATTAQEAAKAYNASGTVSAATCNGSESAYCNSGGAMCACFIYGTTANSGRAKQGATCGCPTSAADVAWN